MSSGKPSKEEDLRARLTALAAAELDPLRAEWLQLYRSPPPPRLSRDLLARGIAHKLQEAAYGGVPPATRRKLAAFAETGAGDGTPKRLPSPPQLRQGTTLVRSWGGQTHTVQVLDDGFEYQERRHRSLSQIAKLITGAHWSGPRFFGLNQTGPASAPSEGRG